MEEHVDKGPEGHASSLEPAETIEESVLLLDRLAAKERAIIDSCSQPFDLDNLITLATSKSGLVNVSIRRIACGNTPL